MSMVHQRALCSHSVLLAQPEEPGSALHLLNLTIVDHALIALKQTMQEQNAMMWLLGLRLTSGQSSHVSALKP